MGIIEWGLAFSSRNPRGGSGVAGKGRGGGGGTGSRMSNHPRQDEKLRVLVRPQGDPGLVDLGFLLDVRVLKKRFQSCVLLSLDACGWARHIFTNLSSSPLSRLPFFFKTYLGRCFSRLTSVICSTTWKHFAGEATALKGGARSK